MADDGGWVFGRVYFVDSFLCICTKMSDIAHVPQFIIEGGNNIVIIMLFALFYPLSDVNVLLHNSTENVIWIYLQEFINHHFVERVRHNKTIVEAVSGNLTRLFFLTGFRCDDINENRIVVLWEFLLTHLCCVPMTVHTRVSTNSLLSLDDKEEKEHMFTIKLRVPSGDEMCSLRQMLRRWFYQEEEVHDEDCDSDIDSIKRTTTHEICNFPKLIGFHLARGSGSTPVDISKKISIMSNKSLNNPKWIFHCMVCYSHKHKVYYTVVLNCDHYVAYYGHNLGYCQQVDMTDSDKCSQMRQDVFFVVYRYFG